MAARLHQHLENNNLHGKPQAAQAHAETKDHEIDKGPLS